MTAKSSPGNSHIDVLNRYQHWETHAKNLFFESSNLELDVSTKASETLENFAKDPDINIVILTGDAGHGKTHLCGSLLSSLTGEPLQKAAETMNEGSNGIVFIEEILADGKNLRFIKDLSDGQIEDLPALFVEILHDDDCLTVMCANDGILRNTCEGSETLSPIVDLLNASVLEGKMMEGKVALLNLNHQSVVSNTADETLVRKVLKQWIDDDEKWADCEGCGVSDQCPILENRNALSEVGVNELNPSVQSIEILLRTVEQLGITITIRDMLFYLSYLITGGLDCEKVHELDALNDDHSWQWRYLFHQIAFASELDEEKRGKSNVLFTVRKLDPGRRAIRKVDDAFNDVSSEYGRFPPAAFHLRKDGDDVIKDQMECWRFLRRKYFFDIKPDETEDLTAEVRMGMKFIPEFQKIINEDSPLDNEQILKRLVEGLEAIQGINRDVGFKFVLVHPALAGHPSPAKLIRKEMRTRDLRLVPRKSAWNAQRKEFDKANDISTAVDWSERAVTIGFDGGKFSHEKSITLYLHEFEYLMASAKGLRSALFFAAEKDKFLGRLEKIGDSEEQKSDDIRIAYENKILDFEHSQSGQLLGGGS
tara:strand:+ start:5256 stop:7037 length:1782 start_codon:yes stop_codon:yes gene_type:complete